MAPNNKNNNQISLRLSSIFRSVPEINIIIASLLVSIVIGAINPNFWNFSNWVNIFRFFVALSLLALGEAGILILGGIDLSVGSMASLTSMVFAYLLAYLKVGLPLSILGVFALGLLIGFYHGVFITRFSPPLPTIVPAFIVTLASLLLLSGVAVGITSGFPIPIPAYVAEFIGSPTSLAVIFVIAFALTYFIHKYTAVGRYMYAIGSNMEAARVAGVPIHKTRIFAYMYSEAMAVLAGIVLTSIVYAGYNSVGQNQELFAIAACAIAGVSLAGGEGSAIGAVLGALLIEIINDGIVLIGVSAYWQNAFTGAILVIAVLVDLIRRTWRRK